jgi:hypothetical protein
MSILFLVLDANGTYSRKLPEDMLPNDRLVFDGPGSTSSLEAAKITLEAEIEAAGGLEKWRSTAPQGT